MIGHGAARASGGALAVFMGFSAVRFALLTWVGSAWWLATDLLLGALLMPWVYRDRSVAVAVVLTTPAWLALSGAMQGDPPSSLWLAILVGCLWQGGLGLWGMAASSHAVRSRHSTIWTVYLLGTLVVAYMLGSAPMFYPETASPMLAGFVETGEKGVFAVFLAGIPLLACLIGMGYRQLSTSLPG